MIGLFSGLIKMTPLVVITCTFLTFTAALVHQDTFEYTNQHVVKHPNDIPCMFKCLQQTDNCIGFDIVEDECKLIFCSGWRRRDIVHAYRAGRKPVRTSFACARKPTYIL